MYNFLFRNHKLDEADTLHIVYNIKVCFCSGQIRTLVAMATNNFHKLVLGKVQLIFFSSNLRYLEN